MILRSFVFASPGSLWRYYASLHTTDNDCAHSTNMLQNIAISKATRLNRTQSSSMHKRPPTSKYHYRGPSVGVGLPGIGIICLPHTQCIHHVREILLKASLQESLVPGTLRFVSYISLTSSWTALLPEDGMTSTKTSMGHFCCHAVRELVFVSKAGVESPKHRAITSSSLDSKTASLRCNPCPPFCSG